MMILNVSAPTPPPTNIVAKLVVPAEAVDVPVPVPVEEEDPSWPSRPEVWLAVDCAVPVPYVPVKEVSDCVPVTVEKERVSDSIVCDVAVPASMPNSQTRESNILDGGQRC